MTVSTFFKSLATLAVITVGVLGSEGQPGGRLALAQSSSTASQSDGSAESDLDPYNRGALIWAMQQSGYASGWQRGRETYYMRCWICHNEYTINAEPGNAPSLRNLYKRGKLHNGQPANDQTVEAQIRNGSLRMPGYAANIDAQEMKDLLTYLREHCSGTSPTDAGCLDLYDPVPNPRYRYPEK